MYYSEPWKESNDCHQTDMENRVDLGEERSRVPGWMPPAADAKGDNPRLFGDGFDRHFYVPNRLADKSFELVETANDFHYAMMNDHPRNEFYRSALAAVIIPGVSTIVEIGTGSGLLSMICAQLGAKHITAIEANMHLAQIARHNIAANGFCDRISVINKLSTEINVDDLPYGKADILVSEILGTLMLGESALEYVADARRHLLREGGIIIPALGRQCVRLVESRDLQSITRADNWGGLDLSGFNSLQDTASVVFTKQYGFRFSSVAHRYLTDRVVVADINFYEGEQGSVALEHRIRVPATSSGTAHAIVYSWEVFSDLNCTHAMTTHPEDTANNFPRDMQWGQALQLLESMDYTVNSRVVPCPLVLTQGEPLELILKVSANGVSMQVLVVREALNRHQEENYNCT